MPTPVIQVEDVTRVYRAGDVEVHALRGISLTVMPGEFVAIMGASGSGKSTLMSILGCLDWPTSGHYFFQGLDVAKLDEPELARVRSERLGFVFQSFNLLPRTSALENVTLPLFYSGSVASSREIRNRKGRAALKLLGLEARERNTPGQLSGGQQQRVAIARALINAPSLLLADEPTGNLDTRTSHEIMETLVSLNREQGVTIIIVTHESDIAAYAARVVTMRDGAIVSDEKAPPRSDIKQVTIGREAESEGLLRRREEPRAARSRAFLAFGLMILWVAAQAINRNRMRSALTMLGVFIGVAALIAMQAVGQGANEAVRKQIESLGTNLIVVVPGAALAGGFRGGSGSASTLTVDDVKAIRREAPAIAKVSYLIRQPGQVQYRNQNWSTTIQGVSANYPPITNWRIAVGRPISQDDESRAALVALIGQTVRRQLFEADETPIGALIQVKGVPLRIIGILAPKGQSTYGQDQDDLVMIPFATAERKVLGVAAPSQAQTPLNWVYLPAPNPYNLQSRMLGYVNQIYVQAVSSGEVQDRHQPVDRHPRAPAPDHAGTGERFCGSQFEPDRRSGGGQQPHHGASPCRGGFDIPGRWRHRHHEHPPSVSDRTHPRNRTADGHWRAPAPRPVAVPRRSGVSQRDRRNRRHSPRGRFFAGDTFHHRLAGAGFTCRGYRRICVLRSGRRFLRLLSCTEGRPSRSNRGASL